MLRSLANPGRSRRTHPARPGLARDARLKEMGLGLPADIFGEVLSCLHMDEVAMVLRSSCALYFHTPLWRVVPVLRTHPRAAMTWGQFLRCHRDVLQLVRYHAVQHLLQSPSAPLRWADVLTLERDQLAALADIAPLWCTVPVDRASGTSLRMWVYQQRAAVANCEFNRTGKWDAVRGVCPLRASVRDFQVQRACAYMPTRLLQLVTHEILSLDASMRPRRERLWYLLLHTPHVVREAIRHMRGLEALRAELGCSHQEMWGWVLDDAAAQHFVPAKAMQVEYVQSVVHATKHVPGFDIMRPLVEVAISFHGEPALSRRRALHTISEHAYPSCPSVEWLSFWGLHGDVLMQLTSADVPVNVPPARPPRCAPGQLQRLVPGVLSVAGMLAACQTLQGQIVCFSLSQYLGRVGHQVLVPAPGAVISAVSGRRDCGAVLPQQSSRIPLVAEYLSTYYPSTCEWVSSTARRSTLPEVEVWRVLIAIAQTGRARTLTGLRQLVGEVVRSLSRPDCPRGPRDATAVAMVSSGFTQDRRPEAVCSPTLAGWVYRIQIPSYVEAWWAPENEADWVDMHAVTTRFSSDMTVLHRVIRGAPTLSRLLRVLNHMPSGAARDSKSVTAAFKSWLRWSRARDLQWSVPKTIVQLAETRVFTSMVMPAVLQCTTAEVRILGRVMDVLGAPTYWVYRLSAELVKSMYKHYSTVVANSLSHASRPAGSAPATGHGPHFSDLEWLLRHIDAVAHWCQCSKCSHALGICTVQDVVADVSHRVESKCRKTGPYFQQFHECLCRPVMVTAEQLLARLPVDSLHVLQHYETWVEAWSGRGLIWHSALRSCGVYSSVFSHVLATSGVDRARQLFELLPGVELRRAMVAQAPTRAVEYDAGVLHCHMHVVKALLHECNGWGLNSVSECLAYVDVLPALHKLMQHGVHSAAHPLNCRLRAIWKPVAYRVLLWVASRRSGIAALFADVPSMMTWASCSVAAEPERVLAWLHEASHTRPPSDVVYRAQHLHEPPPPAAGLLRIQQLLNI